jgi:recombinational DNA repair ATPase RecF
MIKEVSFRRFKQFRATTIKLNPGITLLAGGNNAGKSSLLHGLAVWEFCRTATLMERGEQGLLAAATSKQGFGLGDDEFSPINVPSLKHL